MKLDTTQDGLDSVFKPYQSDIVTRIFELQNSEGIHWKGWTSGEAYVYNQEHSRDPKSRASIIFFLNDLVDEGLLEYTERTGKGGHHRVYKPAFNQEAFMGHITGLFEKKILELWEVWP